MRTFGDAALVDAPHEDLLWRDLRKSGSAIVRDKLVTAHLQFARQVAARHHRRGGWGGIEIQDLRQLAYVGLIEAVDRYEPDRGVPFRSYAYRRISGSILNGIAKLSEIREQIAFRNRTRAERVRSLAPSDLNAAEAGQAMQALAELAIELAMGFMLEESGFAAGGASVDRAPNAYESLAWKEAVRAVWGEIERLPDRQQFILRGHYVDGLGFESLAAQLGLSKGRVSQLHKAGLVALRARLSPDRAFNLQR